MGQRLFMIQQIRLSPRRGGKRKGRAGETRHAGYVPPTHFSSTELVSLIIVV